MTARRLLGLLGAFAVWAVIAVPAWVLLFLASSQQTMIAGHDAVLSPRLDGWSVLHTGALLPDARIRSGARVGADIVIGKSEASSGPELVQRIAVLGANPEAEVRRLTRMIEAMAVTAAVRALVIGMAPVALWLLLGTTRRRELARPSPQHAVIGTMVVVTVAVAGVAPWRAEREPALTTWLPLHQALPGVPVPVELAGMEITGGTMTTQTSRLIRSAIDTYEGSKTFYAEVRQQVIEAAPALRQPENGDTVAVLVSDRHNNVGMDRVAAQLGREAGARVVLDAGDDTSTGASWEGFSLDSLAEAFSSYDVRVGIAGNHDHGDFVTRHLRELGWTVLDGRSATLFGDVRLHGVSDPRSSGLGNWRDESGLSFADVRDRYSAELCRLDAEHQRVATVLVHDANLARPAVERGCVDLVVGGHVHSVSGPQAYDGERGRAYTFTNGTTGGAAYAWAMGSKLRREATITLITWRDGRPLGLQPVTIRTTGEVVVAPFSELTYPER